MMKTALLVVVGLGVALTAATGCQAPCEERGTCTDDGTPNDGGGDADSVGPAQDANVGDGGNAHDGEAAADTADAFVCPSTASPREQPCVVDEAYGVFVSPTGDDGAAGTRAAPKKHWAKAADAALQAGLHDVFACGGTYDEALDVGATRDALHFYGALRCSDWTYDATAVTTLAPAASGIALRIHGVGSASFEDVSFVAKDGAAVGESSIAVMVAESSNVTFRRAAMKSGKGQDGLNGTTTPNYSGVRAASGAAPSGITGGTGGAAVCANGNTSSGGKGGDGVTGLAGNGVTGSSKPPAVTSAGRDGSGGGGGITSCGSSAVPGADGAANAAAAGAQQSGVLATTGWTARSGEDGKAGNPGQGGGGGAGLTSPAGGGGGGGAGGCGGGGGHGGTGGGSSFALLSFQSFVTLESCTLSAKDAGKGGDGASGQDGQAGGDRALSVCTGALGGNGAGGGAGGGGAGGLSVGAGFVGRSPAMDAMTTINVGILGAAGTGVATPTRGGDNGLGASNTGPTSTAGKAGQAALSLDLTTP